MTEPDSRTDGVPDTVPDGERNDAVGHFWRAAHELLAAARQVIDAADSLVEEQMQGGGREPDAAASRRVRRIDVE